MKKLFFVVVLGVAGVMSASEVLRPTKNSKEEEKSSVKIEIKTNDYERMAPTSHCYNKDKNGTLHEVPCPDVIVP